MNALIYIFTLRGVFNGNIEFCEYALIINF